MNKTILIILITGAICLGVYKSKDKKKEEVKTSVKIEKIDTNKHVNKHKTTVIEVKPDGTKKTTIIQDTKIDIDKKVDINAISKLVNVEQTTSSPKANVSLLVGTNTLKTDFLSSQIIYGVSVNKEILGPVTIGAWGLTNKTFGVSVGIGL